jgi:Tol biopolymer transport system component
MKKLVLFSVGIFALLNTAKSQFYETGQDPFSVSWKQIRTSNYKLIFPSGFEKSAQEFASTLDTIYPVIGNDLNKKPKRISVVFHTQSSLSNGVVVYAPKRMELYTIPPQDNQAQDWLNELALHETRHVAQLDALRTGVTKLGSYIFGQQFVGAISALPPRWFFEGDAVYSETEFSKTGRGRSASFAMEYRALALDKNIYSYEKALLGSYKDYVPDVYQMGYPMVKKARDLFASDVFAKSLEYTARNPYLYFSFGLSLKKRHNYNNVSLYKLTYNDLKESWKKQDTADTYNQWPVKKTHSYTNYNNPVYIGDETILAEKSDLTETRQLVNIDKNGKEKRLLYIGGNSGYRTSFYKNQIMWSENRNDMRWQNRTYSEIVIYNLDTKRIKRFRKTWFFSPVFSPDGNAIAAVKETPQYNCSLVILDPISGKVTKEVNAPENIHLQYPVWLSSSEILFLASSKAGKYIIKLNKDNVWEQVTPSSFQNISSFCVAGNKLLLAGERNGTNNIFSFSFTDSTFSQVTFSRFGAFEPFYDAKSEILYFSTYTSDGYRTAFMTWNPETVSVNIPYFNNTEDSFSTRLSQPNFQNSSSNIKNYPVKSYSKITNLFNFHSWMPAYYNYDVTNFSNPAVYPGLMLLSQNLLGTMISSFGYSYQEGYSHLRANISYKALYPVISWGIDAGGPVSRVSGNEFIPIRMNSALNSTVRVSVPISFSQRNKITGTVPYIEWKYNRNAYFIRSDSSYFQEMNFINFGLNAYCYSKMAIRDIFPRWGFSSWFKMQTTPFENKVFNSIYAANLRVYFPGIIRNHSLQLRYGYQYQNPRRYLYGSVLSFPPGYVTSRSEEMHNFEASYSLPLFYPDIHAGPLAYIKRIRTNIFYNTALNYYHQAGAKIITEDILRSVGTDLIADVHFLRLMFPFEVGARFSYLPTEKVLYGQAIFSVNLVY